MVGRRTLEIASLVWAALGFAVGLTAFSSVNPDARWLFAGACLLGPLAATAAAFALRMSQDRWAGVLLMVSVVTPTVFAWPLNIPALVVGLGLVAAPTGVVRRA